MSALSLSDAKAHLNVDWTSDDAEIQDTIEQAEAVIGGLVGPLAPTTRTDRVRGGGKELILPVTPAVSVTSITPVGGAALDTTSFILDGPAGVVAYVAATQYNFARFPLPWYDVVYVAGYTTVPANIMGAVQELVRVLWIPQRGAGRQQRPGTGEEDIPSRALGVIGPDTLPPHVLMLLGHSVQSGFA